MFLSYTTVPLFAFMILLNFFYLYPLIESWDQGNTFDFCEDCKKSPCFVYENQPCYVLFNCKGNTTCYMCHTLNNFRQFYSKKDCDAECKNMGENMECVCDYGCYICIPPHLVNIGIYGLKCLIDFPERSIKCP